MNALSHIGYNETNEKMTSVQELKLFSRELIHVKKEVLEMGAGNTILRKDIDTCYTIIGAIEDILMIAKSLHDDSLLTYATWDIILDRVDIIIDNYSELEMNTEILNTALRTLKTYHSLESESIEKKGNIYYLPSANKTRKRNKLTKDEVIRKLMLGTPTGEHHEISMPSSESKREEVLRNLQKTLTPREAGGIGAQSVAEQIRLNAIQPNKIPSNIIGKINTTALKGDDFEMLGYMSHYMKYEAANEKNYDPNIENAPKLSVHIKNIKPDHPVRIKTTLGEMTILRVVPFFQTHEQVKVYHKAEILFQGVKRRVLIREDMFQVGDTTEILGDFDKNNHLQPATRGSALFAIQSIHSEKVQRKKIEPTLVQRFSKNMSSLKNTVLGMFRK